MLFDPYEMRARLTPALIVTSPWVLVVVASAESVSSALLTTSAAALVFVAFLYAFSFAVRQLGRRIEPRLWKSWGGPPSATILLDGDGEFSPETKAEIRASLAGVLGIEGADEPNWARDADRVQEAFRRVRQYIRQHDPSGLWATHDAEYGFLRNLLGSWWLFAANSLLALALCAFLWYERAGSTAATLTVLSAVMGLMSVLLRYCVLPSAVRTAALRYAESAWTSFLVVAHSNKPGTKGPGR